MKTKSSLALLLCGSALSGTAAANPLCDVNYIIQHSWQTGAVHRVQVDYNGPATTGWELSWRFPGQERINSIFNVVPSQQGNEVTVTNLGWNARIRPGSELKFGFNVSSPSGDVPTEFIFNGERCGDPGDGTPDQPDPAEPDQPDPVEPDQPDPVEPEQPDPVEPDEPDPVEPEPEDPQDPVTPPASSAWTLDAARSYLGFLSTKNQHNVEAHSFGSLSGTVLADGTASLVIELDTVETGIDIRNQRMRELLFNTNANPDATVALELGDHLGQALAMSPGEVMTLAVPAMLELNGEPRELNVSLQVERLAEFTFVVSSAQPVLITADQFGLQSGVDALRQVAGLNAISLAVPVDFALFFKADQRPTP